MEVLKNDLSIPIKLVPDFSDPSCGVISGPSHVPYLGEQLVFIKLERGVKYSIQAC
jgi:hypothetical protein